MLLYPAKLSINIDGETKIFHDKTKFTQYHSTNSALQRIVDGELQQKEGNYTLEKFQKLAEEEKKTLICAMKALLPTFLTVINYNFHCNYNIGLSYRLPHALLAYGL